MMIIDIFKNNWDLYGRIKLVGFKFVHFEKLQLSVNGCEILNLKIGILFWHKSGKLKDCFS